MYMASNNNDLIPRSAVIRAIRNHINVNRERADRGYAAMIREEDIEIIKGVPEVKNKHMRALAFTAIGYRGRKARRQSGNYCPNCGARMKKGGLFDEKINGWWVDENGNRWSEQYSENQAEKYSKTITNCSDCSYCSHCDNCFGCSRCRGFARNPQRIVSGAMGSRNDQTVVYYDGENTQVVCGCFRGDMNEFEEKVRGTHMENPVYLEQYLNFIEKVRAFWGIKKEERND